MPALNETKRERKQEVQCMATEEGSVLPSSFGGMAQAPLPEGAQRAVTFGLLLSAVRCTVQYLLLPFVLPWIGVTATIPPWVTLALGTLALAALARNVRSLWRLHHPRRWSYLLLALMVIGSLLVFTVVDLHTLLRA
jgi:hypothetical protein